MTGPSDGPVNPIDNKDEAIRALQEELRRTNSEFMQLTLDLDARVEARTVELENANVQLHRAERIARRYGRQQAAIADLGRAALVERELGSLMEKAVATLSQTLDVDYCKVLELEPEDDVLLLRSGVGWKPGLMGSARVGTGKDSQAGYTLLSGQPVIVEDLREETRFTGPPLLVDHGVVSGISVTIAGPDRPFGVLGAHTRKRRRFSAEDVQFLEAVAHVLAEAVERRRAEEAVEHSEARLKLALDAAHMGAWDSNFSSDEIIWSESVAPLFGLGAGEFTGTRDSFYEYVHPGDRDAVKQATQRAIEDNVDFDVEHRILHPDGSVRWVASRGRVFSDDAGKPLHMLGAVMDITERKCTQDALEQRTDELTRSNEELQQFAYVASHDLQEPLRMVSSYVQLLARRYQGKLDEDADDFIGYAVDGAQRMQGLIGDLLAYSRVGTHGNPLQPTDCEEALSQTLEALKLAVEESGAAVTHDQLPTVVGDAGQLRQLFQNLIANALKFRGEAAPEVHVSAEKVDEDWVFSVADKGIGIDPQFVDRIFVIFQRLHGKDEYPGTGIGLSVCKRIVERHGGRIWVESAVGEGATFYFTVPDREAE